jgi:hypothetical protein
MTKTFSKASFVQEDLNYLAGVARLMTSVAARRSGGVNSLHAFSVVASIARSCDVCFGVWPDPKQPYGVGVEVIKGRNRLRDIVSAKSSDGPLLSLRAVPCISKAHAIAAQKAWEPD